MMLGDKVKADDAKQIGMVYKVVEPENLEETVSGIAQTLSEMPTQALGYTKRLLNQSMNNSLQEQLEMESELQIASAQSDDYSEGVAAFIEKRKPNFTGK